MELSLTLWGQGRPSLQSLTPLSQDCTLTAVHIVISILGLEKILFETLVSPDVSLHLRDPLGTCAMPSTVLVPSS